MVLTELMGRFAMACRIVLAEHVSQLFACDARFAAKQPQGREQTAGEWGRIGRGVARGELQRLARMCGCPVELPTCELEDLPAVEGRKDILSIADFLTETQRALEYPLKLGRGISLGCNQRREERQAEPVFDPRTLDAIFDGIKQCQTPLEMRD